MAIHCARSCLLQKSLGYECKKQSCQRRQRVLENLFKSCALYLLKVNTICVEPSKLPSYQKLSVHRGRPRERSCTKRRRSRDALCIPVRKPLITSVRGGGPKEKINMHRYVEAYKLANIALRPNISLKDEARIIARYYYKKDKVCNFKVKRIWKYHQTYFTAIKKIFDDITIREKPAKSIDETFAANVCCKIMENVLHRHGGAEDISEHKSFAAAVCSSIADAICNRRGSSSAEDNQFASAEANRLDGQSLEIAGRQRTDNYGQNILQLIPKTAKEPEEDDIIDDDIIDDDIIDDKAETEDPGAASAEQVLDGFQEQNKEEQNKEDIFGNVGLSANVASNITKSDITGHNLIRFDLDQRERLLDLDPSWKQIPITQKNDGKRRFGGDWTSFFNKIIEGVNPHCVFAFKNNNIKQERSRKRKSPFFKSNAICTVEPCKCKVFLVIQEEQHNLLHLRFSGNVEHNSSILKARKITGAERTNLREEFAQSGSKPSTVYRSRLNALNPKAYASGNRSGCGVTAKAFQHVSAEANAMRNDVSLIVEKIRKCDQKIRLEESRLHKSLMSTQKITGYVQSSDFTNDNFNVVLMDEGSVRLYRHVCLKDILFFDATGSVVEKIKGYKRVLLYSLTTRNPFGKTPPVPLAELISSSHTATAIRRLFISLREKERTLYGDNATPFAIRTDFSLAIISACIQEYNGISINEYLDQCFDIATGAIKGNQRLTLVLICAAHVMKTNAKNIEKHAKRGIASVNQQSFKHMAMRIIGLLVNTDTLNDALFIIKLAYIIFMTEKESAQLKETVDRLFQIVNTFEMPPHDSYGETDEDECNDMGSSALKAQGKFKARIEVEIDKISLDSHAENNVEMVPTNKYFLPTYFNYIYNVLLPYIPLWTRIMLQSELNVQLEENFQTVRGKTMFDGGYTNAYAENYFTFVKQGFVKNPVPIDAFIYRHFQDVQGLRRQYLDTVRTSCGNGKMETKKQERHFRSIDKSTPIYPDDEDLFQQPSDDELEDVEQWNKLRPKKRGQSRISGFYQEPPETPLSYNRSRIRQKQNRSKTGIVSNEDRMRFQIFKARQWASVSPKIPSTEKCLKELQKRYLQLSNSEKNDINTPRPHQTILYCICKKAYKPSDPLMVQCNLCENWYHSTCIKMDDEFLSKQIARYHCNACVDKTFRSLINYATHMEEEVNDDKSHVIKKLDNEVNSFDIETQQIIRSHTFLQQDLPRSPVSLNLLNHNRGIKNEKSNCWLSAVVHVVCGTGIADLLLSYDREMKLEVSRFLTLIRIRLTRNVKAALTLRMVQDIAMSLDAEFFNPHSNDQKDAAEFYASLITFYFDNAVSDRMITDHKIICLELRHCITCAQTAGSLYRGSLWNLAVADTDIPVILTDLIWVHMRGSFYERDPEHAQNVCSEKCKASSIWETTFIRNFPSVLVINLNRGNWIANNNRINQTQVVIQRRLDLSEYTMRNSPDNFHYELAAIICHHAVTNEYGHYSAHLVDDSFVTTYDDVTVKKRKADNFFELPTIQKSIHMLFYFLKPNNSHQVTGQNTHILKAKEQKIVEKYWFGLLQPENSQIDLHDSRTVWNNRNVNGDIITQFLFASASSITEKKILTTTSNFLPNIKEKRFYTAECKYILNRADIFDLDAVVIPVNVGNEHWVISSIYPKGRCSVVIDSLKDPTQGKKTFEAIIMFLTAYASLHGLAFSVNEWVFVSPRHLPAQTDASSCGVFACVHGYNCMLTGQLHMPRPSNVLHHRYWIAYVACSSNGSRKYNTSTIDGRLSLHNVYSTKQSSFLIRNNVPGFGKMAHFFEALSKYIDVRKKTSLSAPVDTDSRQQTSQKGIEEESTSHYADTGKNNNIEDEAVATDLHSGSEESLDSEQADLKFTTNKISKIKNRLLLRLKIDMVEGNERYVFLAKYGKSKLLDIFQEELLVMHQRIGNYGLEIMKGALYRLFCNPQSDHEYFNICLPTIEQNRYGFTSVQFIDYVVLPDAVCMDYMLSKGITYEEAVSQTCGKQQSKLTVYWNHLLLKDDRVEIRKQISEGSEMQAILGELQKEHVNIIVAVVDEKMQAVGRGAENLLQNAKFNVSVDGKQLLSSCVVKCDPGKLRCDQLLLHVARPRSEGLEEAPKNTDVIENIFKATEDISTCSISMPLFTQGYDEEEKAEAIADQIQLIEQTVKTSNSKQTSFIIRLIADNEQEYCVLGQKMLSQGS